MDHKRLGSLWTNVWFPYEPIPVSSQLKPYIVNVKGGHGEPTDCQAQRCDKTDGDFQCFDCVNEPLSQHSSVLKTHLLVKTSS